MAKQTDGLVKPRSVSDRKEMWHWSFSGFDSLFSVKAAIRELELGQLARPAVLLDAMTRDDALGGALKRRAEALPSLPLSVEKGTGRHAQYVADSLGKDFEKMAPDSELASLVQWGITLGVGFAEVKWKLNSSRWMPRLRVWHPWAFHYRHDLEKWFGTDQNGTFEVTPGNGQWVVYEPYGRKGFLRASVRELYMPWLLRQWGQRDSGRYSEVYGSPIRKGYVPRDASKETVDAFMRELAALGNETSITLPRGINGQPGFDLELLEARGDGMDQFLALINNAKTDIRVAILGQNLTTEVSGGSYAAAKVHESVRNDLLQADADKLSDCINEQLVLPWAVFNFGTQEIAPKICWNTQPPEDKKTEGDAMAALAAGLVAMKAAGVNLDIDKIIEAKGYPVSEPSEEAEEGEEAEEEEKAEGESEEEAKESETLSMPSDKQMAGAIFGQAFQDAMVTSAASEAGAKAGKEMAILLSAVMESSSYGELRKKLVEAYKDMSTDGLSEVLYKALVLAQLNGIDSVFEGKPE